MSALATLDVTLVAPGMSKNRRVYTAEAIAKAYGRLSQRLSDQGSLPVVNFTSHEKAWEDDPRSIVGRLAAVSLDGEGALHGQMEMPDTQAARDVLKLVEDGFLRSGSIRGRWLGEVETKDDDDGPYETAADMEIVGYDFTHSPGVDAARIKAATRHMESAPGAPVGFFVEEAPAHLTHMAPPQIEETASQAPKAPAAPSQESTMPETKTAAETAPAEAKPEAAAPAAELTEHDKALIAAVVEAIKPAPVAEHTETAPAAETTPASAGLSESAISALVEAKLAEAIPSIAEKVKDSLRAEMRQSATRTGVVPQNSEGAPAKPLHEMSPEELTAYADSRMAKPFFGGLQPAQTV